MNADHTTGADISPRDDKPTISAATPATTIIGKSTFFSFLRMPLELRNMVYRALLVSRHRIHLDCIAPKRVNQRCLHRLVFCTPLLRVCCQISSEALDILYGENEFVCDGDCVPPSVLQDFSPANQLRLRKITLVHACFVRGVDIDPLYDYDSDWSPVFGYDSDYDTDSLDEDLTDNFGSEERLIIPEPVWHLEASDWRHIFANLTRFTITLTVDCCDWDESIISQDEGFKQYASERMKLALDFYDENVPDTLKVHRRVWCRLHRCSCVKKKKKCARIQRYVKELWSMAS